MVWRNNKKLIVAAAGGVLLVAGAYRFMATRGAPSPYEFVVVERGDVVQAVTVTGRVKPTQAVTLAFERGGKVAAVTVAVGDRVAAGALLARLNRAEFVAQLSEALARVESAVAQLQQYRAALRNQQALLDEVRRGTRLEEIAVKRAELEKARQDLANAYDDVADTLRTASTKTGDAVRVKTTSLFTGELALGYRLLFRPCDESLESDVMFLRAASERSLQVWQAAVAGIGAASSREAWDAAVYDALDRITLFERFLDRLNQALVTECSLKDASLNTPRTDVHTARVTVAAQRSDLSALLQDIAVEQRTVSRVEEELKLTQAGSPPEQIAAQAALVEQAVAAVAGQQAQIKQMEAGVAKIRAELEKTALRSPFAGIVTTVDAKVGEIVAASAPVVSLITDAGYEIEANVPEADIAKVTLGGRAILTLDAYGGDMQFLAQVAKIDPAETIIEGVPTYLVTLLFDQPDERIRSGMTADLDIRTAKRVGVIVLPLRSVYGKNGGKFVRTLQRKASGGEEVVEVVVTTGLRGSDGTIEIITGLQAGDRVVTEFSE